MAKGLDCGTSYYIAATDKSIKKQRNVFLTVDGDAKQVKRMLKRQNIPFVEKAGKVHIVGQHAFNYAQIFSTTELRRPMASGLVSLIESIHMGLVLGWNGVFPFLKFLEFWFDPGEFGFSSLFLFGFWFRLMVLRGFF